MKLKDLISKDCIKPDLEKTDRDAHVQEMLKIHVNAGRINIRQAEEFADRIIEREEIQSTGIGKGVAIPYLREESLEETSGVLGISKKGINFNSQDGRPVYFSVLLLNKGIHAQLKALSTVSLFLGKDYNRKRLGSARTVKEVYKLIEES